MRKNASKIVIDLLYFVSGAVIYSVAVNMFLSPNGISPGGFTGVATVVNYITQIPTGVMLFVFNIPVLILGYIKMGGMFILKTSFVTALVSFSLDVSSRLLPPLKTDGILASLFGGILMGLGLSLILLRGATTGGIDIIAKLINRKYRHLSVGKIILMADGFVIILTALVYKNAEIALYSVVAIYVGTRMMDILLYGADRGKIIYIVTNQPDLICREINNTIGRGVTRLSVVGGYTGESRTMLMCTVRVHEAAAVHDVIREYDERAFIVVSDAGEIIGEGFKMHNA
ncbi:MAG: YitT family protein [Clostridia bacterium]|nr:YitT family protein [Clostridia bacterium]